MENGILYIIATPIGNMEDITFRAINTLKDEIDYIYCEDTRQSRKLLNHYGISKPTRSLHTHSPQRKFDQVIELLQAGQSVAYMTDSGTPGISDPGSKLVNIVQEHKLPVLPLPGASALSTLISVSGFQHKRVIFNGFLSKKAGKRKKELESLKQLDGVIIVYESPYRIKKLLMVIQDVFPDAKIVIGREMTKFYEEYIHGTISHIIENIDTLKEKGEFAVAILNSDKL